LSAAVFRQTAAWLKSDRRLDSDVEKETAAVRGKIKP